MRAYQFTKVLDQWEHNWIRKHINNQRSISKEFYRNIGDEIGQRKIWIQYEQRLVKDSSFKGAKVTLEEKRRKRRRRRRPIFKGTSSGRTTMRPG